MFKKNMRRINIEKYYPALLLVIISILILFIV